MAKANLLSKIANSKMAARAAGRTVTLKELESAIKNLQAAEAILKRKSVEIAEKKRVANVKKVQAIMEDLGVSKADLEPPKKPKAKASRKGSKKRGKVAPKYELKLAGQTHTWTGRGRMPLVFKDYAEKEGSLEKLLIKRR